MIIDINTYSAKDSDHVLIDTNVWLYLHCPIGGHEPELVATYSSFFKKLREANAKLYVTSQTLSEFIYRYVRLDFRLFKEETGKSDFKRHYRKSEMYKATTELISNTVSSKIVGHASRLPDAFDSISMENICSPIGNFDYNDAYLAELAINHKMTVLTHDFDFVCFADRVTVMTGNQTILSESKKKPPKSPKAKTK